MKALLDYVNTVTDSRQEKKVLHKMMDIIMIVFFAMPANADDQVEMDVFAREHEDFLRDYLELSNGIASHDTIQRVFAIVPSEFLKNFQRQWNEMLNSDDGDKIKRLPDRLNIKGTIITTDAMGTQRDIAKKIRQKRADYVLALKAN